MSNNNPLPRKKRDKAARDEKVNPPPLIDNPLQNNPPLTPTELVDELTRVVDEIEKLLDNPPKKQPTAEIAAKMEQVRQMSTFLAAVYANMIRIEVEEEGAKPKPPTEAQRALAIRTEALGWTLRALQEKASIYMSPPPAKPSLSAKKRKSRMERTQGDGEWKKM